MSDESNKGWSSAPLAYTISEMKKGIAAIRELIGNGLDHLRQNKMRRAAFEYYLMRVSDASTALPADWKSALGADVRWVSVGELGDIVVERYYDCDRESEEFYVHDLGPLEAAIDRMIAAHGPT